MLPFNKVTPIVLLLNKFISRMLLFRERLQFLTYSTSDKFVFTQGIVLYSFLSGFQCTSEEIYGQGEGRGIMWGGRWLVCEWKSFCQHAYREPA